MNMSEFARDRLEPDSLGSKHCGHLVLSRSSSIFALIHQRPPMSQVIGNLSTRSLIELNTRD